MIVEFFGLPGVGKSTIARALAEETGWPIIKVRSRLTLLALAVWLAIRHPVRSCALYRFARAAAPTRAHFRYLLINSVLHTQAKWWLARRHPDAIVDQGYAQSLLSLYSAQRAEEILRRTPMFPYGDLVVMPTAPKTARAERLAARGYGVRDGMAEDGWEAAAETFAPALAARLKTVASVVEPQNVSGVDDAVAQVRRLVEQYRQRSAGPA